MQPLRFVQRHRRNPFIMSSISRVLGSAIALAFLSLTSQASAPPLPDSGARNLREFIERFTVDRESVAHVYDDPLSPAREERFRRFYQDWQKQLEKLDFASLDEDGRIDYLLLQNHLRHALRQLDLRKRQREEMRPLIPFEDVIFSFEDPRRRMEPPQPPKVAAALQRMTKQISELRAAIEAGSPAATAGTSGTTDPASPSIPPPRASQTGARQAVSAIAQLRSALKNWFSNYNGYDPEFTWWVAEPYKE